MVIHHRRTRAVSRALALLLLGYVAVATFAAAGPATAAAPRTESDNTPGKLMLVLDSSGSMKEKAAGGETKIGAAKKALNEVIGKLPADQPVGMRVFGAQVFSAKDPGACTDSQRTVPLAADNRAALRQAVSRYRPYGETPIGYALQQTGKDLGTSGKRSIVLVSDGEPTCQPDPCEVAKKLSADGIDLRIDVVGLDVNEKARGALECIAHAGHGVYYDVDNSRDFAQSLIKVATRAARPYSAIGQAVTGTPSADQAPVISNGDWLDVTDGSKDRYYTIRRTLKGSTVTFAAAFRDPEDTVFNTVNLSTADGQSCGTSGSVDPQASNVLISSASTAGPLDDAGNPDDASPCATADTLIAKVTYSGGSTGVPVEMRVTELPGVTDVASLPEQVADVQWVPPPGGAGTPTQGGTSFDDAPTLQPGAYRDNIVQGETLTYQVAVDWGQQLTAEVTYPKLDDQRAKALTGSPVSTLSVFAPTRAPAAASGAGTHSNRTSMTKFGSSMGTVSGPVRFRNTGSSNTGINGAADAGVYTVTVFLSKKPGGVSIPVPFTLSLGVSGTPEGKPAFESAPVSPEDSAPSAKPSASADGPSSSTPAADAGGFPLKPVLGGLGVLALLGAVVVAVRSRGAIG